ncbi:MAG: LuxR C-terminal-related transcriptional regulator [Ardenticatenaceae bacterium]
MSLFLLRTKFYIPTSRPELVSRRRLIERLNGGLGGRLTLVSAPAGFGKTTLLADWSRGCERPFAWLSLDEGDNDVGRFLSYFVAALQRIGAETARIGEGVQEALLSPPPPPPEALLTALINDLATLGEPVVLVLDDYHLIDAPAIDQALTFLLRHLPPSLHLVIATRADPSLPLSRLRARAQLSELRTADLRFTPDEAATFLNLVTGLEVSADDVAALESRTEGWIAGLQLAALSMQGTDDISGFINTFTGTHRYIIDYLADEVLLQCSEAVKGFLLQTSILNRLCGSLCNALTDQRDGQAILAHLEQANLFLVPLDHQRRWYRYHHLFADLLRQRLHQQHTPDEVARLHQRASQWFEAHGLLSEALHHTLVTQDFERAARLMGQHVTDKIMRGEISTVRDWLEALPEAIIHAHPVLCFGKAWIHYFSLQYEAIEPLLQLAEQKSKETFSAGSISLSDLLGGTMALRAFVARQRGDGDAAIGFLRHSLAHLPKENVFARGMNTFFLANALYGKGDTNAASRLYPEAIALCLAAGNMLAATGAIQSLATLQMMEGRLHEAKATLLKALFQLTAPNKAPLQATTFLYLGLGKVLYEQNELQDAETYLQQGTNLFKRSSSLPAGLGYLTLAQVKHALGDEEGARLALQQGEQVYRSMEAGSKDAAYVATHRVRCLLAVGDLAAAIRWAQECDVHVDQKPTYAHEFELITLAHVLIAQAKALLRQAQEPLLRPRSLSLSKGRAPQAQEPDHLAHATKLLQRLHKSATAGGRTGRVIEILVLQAIAHAAQNKRPQALSALEQALTLAEPEGYVRLFLDQGTSMATLLYEAAAQGIKPHYIGRLLAAFPDIQATPTTKSALRQAQGSASNRQKQPAQLVEPLSQREIEVLHLIADGLTNRQIANHLHLSLNTVKGHTRKIYGKLGVNSRTQAIGKARAFGILQSH